MAVVAVYDANVLYPSTLRDVLIRVCLARLVSAKWTALILDETFRNLQANRPDLSPNRLARTRAFMGKALRDVEVTGYEHLIEQLDLPDADDRHVLAAAVTADAGVIVTKNLKHFPATALAPYGIRAAHPDAFLTALTQAHPRTMVTVIEEIAAAWRAPDASPESVLTSLAGEAPDTVDLLREVLSDQPDRQGP